MINNFFKYFITGLTLIIILVILIEGIILPYYVGSNNEIYLPDVRGMYKHHAENKLKGLNLKVKVENIPYTSDFEIGKVVKMSPLPPMKIKDRRTIEISVPTGKNSLFMPNILNMTLRNAIIEIERNNLILDTIMYEHFTEYEKDIITVQNPREGNLVETEALVSIMVSKGPHPDIFIVPDLINLSLKRGIMNLNKAGLRMGNIDYEYQPSLLEGTIIEQSLTPGMSVSIPAAVDIIVSTEEKKEDK